MFSVLQMEALFVPVAPLPWVRQMVHKEKLSETSMGTHVFLF